MSAARQVWGGALITTLFIAAPAVAARPDTPGNSELFHYFESDVVESFDSVGGSFRMHYTRAGENAVPSADLDVSGVPDFVEEAAATYDAALAFYQSLGFRVPRSDEDVADNGGNGRSDVYLLDFAGRADGSFRTETCDADAACTGYMVHENDFVGYGYGSATIGNRILASHELFHAVQAAYRSGQGSIVDEGTAVWATEQFDSSLNDFEGFVQGYLKRPDRQLDKPLPDPADPFSYGSAIFFEFLSEKFAPTIIRELWEATLPVAGVGTVDWFPALDKLLADKYLSSFADAFQEFVRWNLFTGMRADPTQSYARAGSYGLVKIDPQTLPVSLPSLRIFPASAQYYGVAPGARSTIAAALKDKAAGDAVVLGVAVRRGNKIDAPLISAAQRVLIDAAGADEVIVFVINTAQSGESSKPTLCIGDSTEVDTCAGVVTPPPMESGGCQAAPGPGHDENNRAFAGLLLILAAWLTKRTTVLL